MPLVDVELTIPGTLLPRDVESFVREAERRVERFQMKHCIPGFVPSDFRRAYRVLQALAAADLAPGNLFCEWGSGFGVVACLAALLEFDAHGIEIEGELVAAARQLASDFDLPVEFVCGSFIPEGGDVHVDIEDGFAWLTPDAGTAYEEMGLATDDFDLVFAYPWPDEEGLTERLFQRYAAVGALLVTYHGEETARVRRKMSAKSRRK